MKQFIKLFNKVGGKDILKQYMHAHVLLYSFLQTVLLGFSKKSLEIVRLAVNNKILKKLRKQYANVINEFQENYLIEELNGKQTEHQRNIWFCWLQGLDQAPDIVKRCYQSLRENIKDREIILLSENNIKEYVKFPDDIQLKMKNGIIPRAHMSDLLRLELLLKYGGTWIDATVFCSDQPEEYMLDTDLFMFQNLKPGLDGHSTSISNWFISASPNNVLLKLTQTLLYEYWRRNDKLVDYFIFHDMFQLAIEAYPDQWKKVVPYSNSVPHIVLLRLFEQYDETTWNAVRKMCPFHKLTYKFSENETEKTGTYFEKIVLQKDCIVDDNDGDCKGKNR